MGGWSTDGEAWQPLHRPFVRPFRRLPRASTFTLDMRTGYALTESDITYDSPGRSD